MHVDELTDGLAEYAGRGITTFANWWHGGGRLVCTYRHGKGKQAWKLLAFALEYQERLNVDRVDIVLPHAAETPTAMRLGLLQPKLGLHLHVKSNDGELRPVAAMSLDEAVKAYGGLGKVRRRPDPGDTSGLPSWLQELADWVETRRVERVRMRGYFSWQFGGRQVLKARYRRTDKAWELTAGVAYKTPKGNQPTVRSVHADGPLEPANREALRGAIDDAIENRRTGHDNGHRESLLQSAIGEDPATIGLVEVDREVPAWRPQGSAKIDFVGFDEDGRMQVVETKIGGDPQLGIQGLDYWAWTRAHQSELIDDLVGGDGDAVSPPVIRYVLGTSDKPLLHAAATATMEAIHPKIDWRVQVIEDWNTLDEATHLLRPKLANRLPPKTLPEIEPS